MNTGLNTRVIHHGDSFAGDTGTVMPPIFPTSTFAHGNAGGFDYTRSGNPNFRILDGVLASVEGCAHATVFASGVSAITAVVSQLKQGDLVLCEENLYGCTVRLFEQVFAKFGLITAWVDFTQPAALEQIQAQKPAMVWLESPTNPLLKVIDLEAVCAITQPLGIPVVVDNTFATALVQRPLELGATLSLTSTTKYINGHSDALGGAVCTNDPEWHEKMVFSQKALGLQPSPFDCWLLGLDLLQCGRLGEVHPSGFEPKLGEHLLEQAYGAAVEVLFTEHQIALFQLGDHSGDGADAGGKHGGVGAALNRGQHPIEDPEVGVAGTGVIKPS